MPGTDSDRITLTFFCQRAFNIEHAFQGNSFSRSFRIAIGSRTVGRCNYRSMEIALGAWSMLMLSRQSISGSLLKISKALDDKTPHEP